MGAKKNNNLSPVTVIIVTKNQNTLNNEFEHKMQVISLCTNIARISTISKLTLYQKHMNCQLTTI